MNRQEYRGEGCLTCTGTVVSSSAISLRDRTLCFVGPGLVCAFGQGLVADTNTNPEQQLFAGGCQGDHAIQQGAVGRVGA